MPDTTPRTIAQLRSAMRAHENRTSGTSILGIYISRPAGRWLAAVAYRLHLTPNALTILSVVLTVCAAIVLPLGSESWTFAIAAMLLLTVAEFLDYADGDLARVLRRSSRFGEWLDHTVDPAKRVIAAGSIAATLSDGPYAHEAPIVITLYLAVVLVTYTAGALFPKLVDAGTPAPDGGAPSSPPAVMSPARRITSTSFLALADPILVAVSALLVGNDRVLVAYLLFLTISNALVMLALLVKWGRQLLLSDARAASASRSSTAG